MGCKEPHLWNVFVRNIRSPHTYTRYMYIIKQSTLSRSYTSEWYTMMNVSSRGYNKDKRLYNNGVLMSTRTTESEPFLDLCMSSCLWTML